MNVLKSYLNIDVISGLSEREWMNLFEKKSKTKELKRVSNSFYLVLPLNPANETNEMISMPCVKKLYKSNKISKNKSSNCYDIVKNLGVSPLKVPNCINCYKSCFALKKSEELVFIGK